jgi:hypothetical protein
VCAVAIFPSLCIQPKQGMFGNLTPDMVCMGRCVGVCLLRKKREELEQSVNYNGLCVLSVNAEDLPHGRAPHLTSANMLSSVQAPLSRKDVLSLGGHIVAQPLVGGGGSFIMGYQRDCSASSSVSLHAETGDSPLSSP